MERVFVCLAKIPPRTKRVFGMTIDFCGGGSCTKLAVCFLDLCQRLLQAGKYASGWIPAFAGKTGLLWVMRLLACAVT